MSDQTIRASILARLQALTPAIGTVHDYERWVIDSQKFLELFKDATTGKIFGWEIVRTGFEVTKATMAKRRISHQYTLRGFYALNDDAGTEKAINALADLIVDDLIRTRLPDTENNLLPRAEVGTKLFGSVLCHVIEIKLPKVDEIISPLEVDEGYLQSVGLNYYLQPDDGVADASDVVTLGTENAG